MIMDFWRLIAMLGTPVHIRVSGVEDSQATLLVLKKCQTNAKSVSLAVA